MENPTNDKKPWYKNGKVNSTIVAILSAIFLIFGEDIPEQTIEVLVAEILGGFGAVYALIALAKEKLG